MLARHYPKFLWRSGLLLAFMLGRPWTAQGQDLDDTLATVDSMPVTVRELVERIELMPWEEKITEKDFDLAKRRALESLVAEHLLASYALAHDRGVSPREDLMRRTLEKMFVRDRLFEQEVRSRVTVSEAELREGMRRFAYRMKLLVFRPTTVAEGVQLRALWQETIRSGEPVERFITQVPFKKDTVYLSFGSIDPVMEDAAYRLAKPLECSAPVPSRIFGLLAIVLLEKESSQDYLRLSVADRRQSVLNTLRDRKEQERTRAYVDRTLAGNTMHVDSALFVRLSERLRKIILLDTVARQVEGGFRFAPGDIFQLQDEFVADLRDSLVTGSFGALPLGDFLESLYYYDFHFPSLRPAHFAASFMQLIRAITEAELIAEAGYRKGLQHSKEVQRDLSTWTDYWKAREVMYSRADTVQVSDAQVYMSLWRRHIAQTANALELNVREIYHSNEDTIRMLRAEAMRKGSLESLAHRFWRDRTWGERGESGFFRLGDDEELGGQALKLEIGEIGPPFRNGNGFSVLQLLGRRWRADSSAIDSLLANERRYVRFRLQQAAVNRLVARLAAEQRVAIKYDRLASIPVQNVNFITRRKIGFGGRINAAPLLVPMWEWVGAWKRLQQNL